MAGAPGLDPAVRNVGWRGPLPPRAALPTVPLRLRHVGRQSPGAGGPESDIVSSPWESFWGANTDQRTCLCQGGEATELSPVLGEPLRGSGGASAGQPGRKSLGDPLFLGWEKGNLCTVGVATLGNSMEVPQKTKNRTAI